MRRSELMASCAGLARSRVWVCEGALGGVVDLGYGVLDLSSTRIRAVGGFESGAAGRVVIAVRLFRLTISRR